MLQRGQSHSGLFSFEDVIYWKVSSWNWIMAKLKWKHTRSVQETACKIYTEYTLLTGWFCWEPRHLASKVKHVYVLNLSLEIFWDSPFILQSWISSLKTAWWAQTPQRKKGGFSEIAIDHSRFIRVLFADFPTEIVKVSLSAWLCKDASAGCQH